MAVISALQCGMLVFVIKCLHMEQQHRQSRRKRGAHLADVIIDGDVLQRGAQRCCQRRCAAGLSLQQSEQCGRRAILCHCTRILERSAGSTTQASARGSTMIPQTTTTHLARYLQHKERFLQTLLLSGVVL